MGILGVIDRYVRMFTKFPGEDGKPLAGLSEEESRKRAIKNLEKLLGRKETVKKPSWGIERDVDRVKRLKEESEAFTKNIRSGDRDKVIAAENEMQSNKFGAKTAAEGKVILQTAWEAAQARGEAPTWLQTEAEAIQHNTQAAETIAVISVLPKDMQENPYVLYRLLRQMERSVDYQSATTLSILETRAVRNRLVSKIQERISELAKTNKDAPRDFQGFENDDVFSTKFDLYRNKKLAEVPDAGRKPDDKASDEDYEAWQQARKTEKQRHDLDGDLETMQKQINEQRFIDKEDELRRLGDMQRRLEDGRFSKFDQEIQIDKSTYPEDVDEYVERISARRKVVDAEKQGMEMQRRVQERVEQDIVYKARKKEDLAERIAELEKQGAVKVWTEELAKRFPHAKIAIGEIIHIREFSPESLDLILRGDLDGLKEWYSKFWQSIYTFGTARGHVDIADQYEWKQFEKLLDILYPDGLQHVKHQFKEQWAEIGTIDAVVKSFYSAGDLKEKSKGMAFLLPRHMQYLFRNFEMSEYTYSLTKEAIMDRLGRRFADFDSKVLWLKGALDQNELHILHRDAPDVLARLQADAAKRGTPLSRDRLLKDLQELYATRDASGKITGFGKLSPELYDFMMELQRARDRAGRGEYLRDYDMMGNGSLHQELSELHARCGEIQMKLDVDAAETETPRRLPTHERTALENQLRELKIRMGEDWKMLTELPGESRVLNNNDLTAISGFSPIEIEVRERLLPFLRQKMNLNEVQFAAWLGKNEWRVRNAVLAARYASVGWGDVLDIAARTARAPTLDLDSEVFGVAGRDVMPGAVAEPVIRALNKEWFRDRFGIGGKFGDEIYDHYYQIMFERQAPDFWAHMSPVAKREIRQLQKEGKPVYKRIIAEAERYYGIPYTEILRPGFLHSGTHFTNSYWRGEVAFTEPYREKMMAWKKEDPQGRREAIIDNQALSLQFAALNPLDEANVPMKMKLLEKMLERTPSRFIQLLGRDLHGIAARCGIDVKSVEWYKFQTALSNAQMHVWDDQHELNVRPVNFMGNAASGDSHDFDTILRPQLNAVGITDAPRQNVFLQFLRNVESYVSTPEGSGRTVLEKWARHNFPLTLPLIDYNVKNARPELLNAFSNERRINDINSMAAAMGQEFELIKPENMSPATGDYTGHVKELKKYRDIINGYDTPAVAETASAAIADTYMYINMDRSMYNVIGWIPFSKRVMRGISEMDLSWIKRTKHNRFMNRITSGAWEQLAEHDISEWPHSVAGAISLAAKYLGGEANSMNANELGAYVSTLEDYGLFTDLRNLPKQLRSKYGSGAFMRYFYHLPRRFWWVPVFGGLTVGLTMAKKDREKEEGHG